MQDNPFNPTQPVAPAGPTEPVTPTTPYDPVAPAPTPTPTPEPTPAPAPMPATPYPGPATQPKKNNTAIIIVVAIVALAIIGGLVAFILLNNNNSNSNSGSSNTDNSSETPAPSGSVSPEQENKNAGKTLSKCSSASDCINKLEISEGITVEQYNEAIGITGTVDEDAYNSEYSTTYIWKFSNGDKLKAQFSEYSKISISVDYDFSAHANMGANLDGYDTIKDKIESGITYDELKAAFGVDGLRSERYGYNDSDSKAGKYLWVGSSAASYIEANVDSHNIVTSVFGRK